MQWHFHLFLILKYLSIFISCTSFTFPAAELSLVDTELIDNTDNASVHTIITLAIIFSFSLSLTLRYQKFLCRISFRPLRTDDMPFFSILDHSLQSINKILSGSSITDLI